MRLLQRTLLCNPIRTYAVRRVQTSDLRQRHSSSASDLVVVFLPGYDHVGGGVLSIASIYSESKRFQFMDGTPVVLCTVPGEPTLFRYRMVPELSSIYSFPDVLRYFREVRRLLVHVPEYAVGKFISHFPRPVLDEMPYLQHVHINVLLQNIRLVDYQAVRKLQKLGTVTCTTAHDAYSTEEVERRLGCRIHRLSVYVSPEQYVRVRYDLKENLMIVSPDAHPSKDRLLREVQRSFPSLRVQIIRGMPYAQYKRLAQRAKWALTFGEGLDGYFVETVFSGGIGIAVFNEDFFTEDFRTLRTVYPSYRELAERLCADLVLLDNPVTYARYQEEQYNLCTRHYDYSSYLDRLEGFYREWLKGSTVASPGAGRTEQRNHALGCTPNPWRDD